MQWTSAAGLKWRKESSLRTRLKHSYEVLNVVVQAKHAAESVSLKDLPDANGHFGPYGGRFVAETLMGPLEELRLAYQKYAKDPDFQAELDADLARFVGRPSPLYHAERWSRKLGGAQIYLKREDLNHTGAHKINNTVGQALLARRMGK